MDVPTTEEMIFLQKSALGVTTNDDRHKSREKPRERFKANSPQELKNDAAK